ncbi:MAG: glycosyltransferase family 4 protein [Deltaproteobacteria bacterium]|nr:glycosyltransferase family 4 protein [Deltaproteobacteria bacterium]
MRILLPILQFPPDVNATGLLMAGLCEGLAAYGHEVRVITTFPHYENFKTWDEYRGRLFEHSRQNGIDVIRLYAYAPGKKSMRNRLLNYLAFNAFATGTGVFSRARWDVILCPNGSFFTGVTGWLIGKAKDAPFVYNVQDLYPEVPIRAGQLCNPYAVATLRGIERFMYRKAAHITVISSLFRDNLLSKGVPAEKISVMPNFVDTEFIRPLPKVNRFSEQHGLADKFVVTHAGNLGYVYDLETLLDAASLLSPQKDILFLIVGNGVAKPELEERARELRLGNVRFMPFQPHESLPWLRASSDIQVSLYKKGAAGYSLPSKIYEIMASGRPLIASCDDKSEIQRVVEASQCGICISPEDSAQLAEGILTLYRNRLLSDAMGQRGRRYAEENHSKQAVVGRYHDLLQRICGSTRISGALASHPIQ